MKIDTRFNVGDKVWTMVNNKPYCFTIGTIHVIVKSGSVVEEVYADYDFSRSRTNPEITNHSAHRCFASKEELAKSLFEDVE